MVNFMIIYNININKDKIVKLKVNIKTKLNFGKI